jgi:hypothetical protein
MAAARPVKPKTSEDTIMAVNTGFRRKIYKMARKYPSVLIIIAIIPYAK